MKITVLQYYDDGYRELHELSRRTVEPWCNARGYKYVAERVTDFNGRHPVWAKLPCIERHLPACDWLFYLDSDAAITNQDFDLVNIIQFIEADRIMAVCDDANGMNAGVLLVRNHPLARKVIHAVYHAPESAVPGGWGDQLGEQRMLEAAISTIGWAHVARFAQRTFNSYLYGLYGGRYHYPQGEWCEGDPVVHLPGVSNETRKKVFNQFIHELHI